MNPQTELLSAEEMQNILKLHGFEIAADDAPFALTGKREKMLKNDDWAWQFLRHNADYKLAYELARSDPRFLTPSELKNLHDHNRHTATQNSIIHSLTESQAEHLLPCRTKFGLSAWLDPGKTDLPGLSAKTDSWFFPSKIMRISDPCAGFKAGIFSLACLNPELASVTTKCKNKNNRSNSAASRQYPTLSRDLWIEIDLNGPIDSQIEIACKIASNYKKTLTTKGARTHLEAIQTHGHDKPSPNHDNPVTRSVERNKILIDENRESILLRKQVSIEIDATIAPTEQIKKIAAYLKQEFSSCSFRAERQFEKMAGNIVTDGFTYKRHITCWLLNQQGLTAPQIADGILKIQHKLHAAKTPEQLEWEANLPLRVAKSIERAQNLIAGDYTALARGPAIT